MVVQSNDYIPEQGDIITINFDPSAGREIQKKRPAIVVSTKNYSLVSGFVAVCPITSTERSHFIKLDDGRQISGYVNALQVKTLDYRARGGKFIEKATTRELGKVAQIIQMIFNFSNLLGE